MISEGCLYDMSSYQQLGLQRLFCDLLRADVFVQLYIRGRRQNLLRQKAFLKITELQLSKI